MSAANGQRFGRSLVFAALAAVGLLAVYAVAWPLGLSQWLPAYLLATAVAYAIWLAPTWRRACVSGAVAFGLALLAAAFTITVGDVAVAAALIVAVCRSAVAYRARPARALVLELGLAISGLVLARFLASDGGALAAALALWGYFLVQSAYFVLSWAAPRNGSSDAGDPFERTRERLEALLGD
ncbi:MAG: hypothetical protein MJE66_12305 [Proteobacteria bacterium]|nr:hypothetical protein [Pseudomonadota bacterium]